MPTLLLASIVWAFFLNTGSALELTCDVASVGGGWAGVYFAYRYLTGSDTAPTKICLFEASGRIGGRTYSKFFQISGPNGTMDEFVVDVGAYRFSPDMHLPGDLILKKLKLPTACYEPDCEPANKDFPPPFVFPYVAPLRRIVDPISKLPSGYVTALNAMVAELENQGAHIIRNAPLVDIKPDSSDGAVLHFRNGETVHAHTVLLNLPRTPMLSLRTVKDLVSPRTLKMLNCVAFDMPRSMFPNMTLGESLTKAYAFYDDAWWHNSLGMTEGQWPSNAFEPLNTSVGIPIGIHFNDGPVICDAPKKGCRGFLEVFYSTQHEDYFELLRNGDMDPSGVLEEKQPGAHAKLARLHAAIMEATESLFTKRGILQPKTPPRMLVVGVWNRRGHGYTAPTKIYYSKEMGNSMAKACDAEWLTEREYRDAMLTPFGNLMPRVHLANNDWVATEIMSFFGDWAEESLLQAERALKLRGLSKPDWLDDDYYSRKVTFLAPESTSTFV